MILVNNCNEHFLQQENFNGLGIRQSVCRDKPQHDNQLEVGCHCFVVKYDERTLVNLQSIVGSTILLAKEQCEKEKMKHEYTKIYLSFRFFVQCWSSFTLTFSNSSSEPTLSLPFFLAAVALAAALAAAARVPFQATVVAFAVSLLLPMHATRTE